MSSPMVPPFYATQIVVACVIHKQFGANIAKYLPSEVGKEI